MTQGGGRARGFTAPAWLEELVRTGRPPVPWRDVVRFAVTIPAPLAVAVAVEGGIEPGPTLGAGVFATMGALVATQAPQPAPLRDRLRRIAAGTAFGVLGLLVGTYATGGGWTPVLVIALVSAAAALISQINSALSLGSLQLLVYTALSSGLVSGLPLATEVGFFLVGWLIQFIGHWYEGRKPAFVDDLVGLLVGPMFVIAELLFMAGWNKPLSAEIERRAGPTHLRDIARIA